MPLTQHRYLIAIDDLDTEHEVTILPVDQLRAENEGNRRGLVEPKRQGTLVTLLWLWAACRRVGLVDRESKFEPFVDRLVAWDAVRDAEGEPEVGEVDPTHEAESSSSASPSLPDSPASTGSEPPSTTPPSSLPPFGSSSPIPSEVP